MNMTAKSYLVLASLMCFTLVEGGHKAHRVNNSTHIRGLADVFIVGKKAAELGVKLLIHEQAIKNKTSKKIFKMKAAFEFAQGIIIAIEDLDLSELLKHQELGFFERHYVKGKVKECIDKLEEITPRPKRTRFTRNQHALLNNCFLFGKNIINTIAKLSVKNIILNDEKLRKEVGLEIAQEILRGIETKSEELDVKLYAEKEQIALTQEQLDAIKGNLSGSLEMLQLDKLWPYIAGLA